ncbi:transposase [Blastopirellula retiformator]|uniref:Transposase n=1 Tax=Blastopirellula retiformator TaxID=2527970 RepID=A0A5C5V831_9BACT|nr:transposase [Blastopirellula retiformator]TWT31521.1 Transposase [Blastopirellula retiformator]TWT34113.1 Transposase [Blastopirellula retiformator]
MSAKAKRKQPPSRRRFTDEFKRDAVQMLLDGHSADSVVQRLGLSSTNLLYRWKREQLRGSGPVAASLESRVKELELELKRVERERDVLKKALAIFSRSD